MPVIAVAVAAPAEAASLSTLTQRVIGPNLVDSSTCNSLYFTNTGTTTIPAGSLTVTVIDQSDDWNYGGFSSNVYSYGAITGSTTSFVLNEDLAAGAETPFLLLVLYSTLPAGSTVRSAPVTVTAPGYATLSFAVSVVTQPAANG